MVADAPAFTLSPQLAALAARVAADHFGISAAVYIERAVLRELQRDLGGFAILSPEAKRATLQALDLGLDALNADLG